MKAIYCDYAIFNEGKAYSVRLTESGEGYIKEQYQKEWQYVCTFNQKSFAFTKAKILLKKYLNTFSPNT